MTYNAVCPAQDFMYPVEYHNRYGYMYPSLEPCIHYGMVQPTNVSRYLLRLSLYSCTVIMDNPYELSFRGSGESMLDDCYDAC